MSAVYSLETGGDIALTAATAKTIIMAVSATPWRPIRMVEFSLSFDGVDPALVPVLVELIYWFKGSDDGTSTSRTVQQIGGPPRATGLIGRIDYSVEVAQAFTMARRAYWWISPAGGRLEVQYPLDKESLRIDEDDAADMGIGFRCTAPDAVNAQAYMVLEEN